MLTFREGSRRRHIKRPGHDTWMAFDPDSRDDLFFEGFRGLLGLDEERLAPGIGVPPPSRSDKVTLTYVRDGVILDEDDLGKSRVMRSGEFQLNSRGTAMGRKRSNGSRVDAAHVFETRLHPETPDTALRCEQRRFAAGDRRGVFLLVAAPEVRPGSFRIHQDVRVFSSLPDRGCHLIHAIRPGRHAWLQVVRGRVKILNLALTAGDGMAFLDEISVSVTAVESSELLLFDLA